MKIKHLYYIKEDMTLESIIDFQKELYNTNPEDTQIYVHINSYGGSGTVGLKLYDLLQTYPGNLCIIGEGDVSSAATLCLFTRHKTYALPNMLCTFHGSTVGWDGKLVDSIAYLNHIDKNISAAFIKIYTNKTDIFTKEALLHDTFYTAKQLEELGIVEIIKELPIGN
jgi:ATP-dependent Clp protease protease subunit